LVIVAATAAALGCGGSPAAGRDAGIGDADPGSADGGVVTVTADRHTGTLCAGGAPARSGGLRATTCVAPVDVAAEARRGDGLRWQPGPVYRVDAEEDRR
jgi:hypothetical protein